MREATLTRWKFVQDERVKEGDNPYVNKKIMVRQIQKAYLPKDFEVQMHTKRENLKQRDNDVASYMEEFQNLCLRSKV